MKQAKTKSQLRLQTQTLRALQSAALTQVVAGAINVSSGTKAHGASCTGSCDNA